ncbi:hypothetical protein POTOM_009491 [Populus tomentosa]|uniref:Uncharacterized protein n=1 Tax=Populus tomentosa TaxID=118781 RepID=A0A8X8DA86_POPTO|nr:hypothetical protein POTOM_009491 [Populus tomentosa]
MISKSCTKTNGLIVKPHQFQANPSRNIDTLVGTPQISSRRKDLNLKRLLSHYLKRFNDSLGCCFNRANMMLGRLEEEGNVNVEDIRPVLHTVLLEKKRIGCGYGELAAAYVAVLNFKEALPFGLKVLEIHKSGLGKNSEEFAHDRKLLGVIYSGSELLHGEIDAANMGIELGKYDEFINTLKGVVQQTEKDSWTQALVFISMAKAPCNLEKFADAKRCLEIACGILDKKETASAAEVAGAYSEIAMQYETRDRFETAISLLKRTLSMLEKLLQEQHAEESSSAIIGWLLLLTCKVYSAIILLFYEGSGTVDCVAAYHAIPLPFNSSGEQWMPGKVMDQGNMSSRPIDASQ